MKGATHSSLPVPLTHHREDAADRGQLFLIFLSDGSPSDHIEMLCPHGAAVWQPSLDYAPLRNGKPRLNNCPSGNHQCRELLRQRVSAMCVARVKTLGDMFGRDRVFIGTCAFGPASEDYAVLKAMAQALPRSSFQKLGLSAAHLRTALSSLTT